MLMTLLAVAAGIFAGQFLYQFYMLHRKEKCPECGRNYRIQRFTPSCDGCMQRMHGLENIRLPIGQSSDLADDMAETIKKAYSDPDVVKTIKRAFGIQSDQERWEDEADKE